MAIFTASQATQSVTDLASQTAATAYTNLIAQYQGIFDLITSQSAQGAVSIQWTLTLSAYTEIKPILLTNGYSVSAWTVGSDVTHSDTITISWPSVPPTVYPTITAIAPTSIQASQNVYFTCQFQAVGGTAPYTYVISGTVPLGLSWSTLTGVTTITLAGTPTQLGEQIPGFTIQATDAHGMTISQSVAWTISASSVITISTQPAGAESLTYNPNTGVLTFTPYLLPASTSTTLGAVIIPPVATSGIVNTNGTIALATASTTQLGAVQVDGSTIKITNGVISIPSTTTVLDQRIRSIAIASAVAFGV